MSATTVACPHCRGQIENDPRLAGEQVSCPYCNRPFLMPTAPAPRSPAHAVAPGAGGGQFDFLNPAMPSAALGVNRGTQGGGFGIRCPFCGHEGRPGIKKKLSGSGWVLFVVLLLLCFPMCWLPFVIDGCKEEERKCFRCGSRFG